MSYTYDANAATWIICITWMVCVGFVCATPIAIAYIMRCGKRHY